MREFHKGEILPHIIFLSWPVLAANGLQNVLSMFDILWMGKVGVFAMSGVAICSPVLSVFWALESGFLAGTVAIISRYCGEGKYEKIGTAAFNMALTGLAVAAIFAAVTIIFTEPILSFFGAKGETLLYTVKYFRIMAISFLNISVLYIMIAVVRGVGDSENAFYTLLVGMVIYLFLEPVFIFGLLGAPKMGMTGGALAYAISYLVPTIIVFYTFFKGQGHMRISSSDFRLDFPLIKKFLIISMPAMAQSLVINLSAMTIIKIASKYGDSFLGAIGVGGRLDMFSSMMGIAVGSGVSVMVGHNLGAKEIARAKKSVTEGIKFFWFIAIPLSLLFLFFAPQILSFFTKDEGVIRYGSMYLRIVPPVYILSCVWLMTSSAFSGAGATNISMAISAIAYLAVQIPLALTLTKTPLAEKGIFIAIACCQAFMGIAGWVMYKRGGWVKGN